MIFFMLGRYYYKVGGAKITHLRAETEFGGGETC